MSGIENMFDIVFWGGTGQAKVLHEALLGSNLRLVALLDNRPLESPIDGIPIFLGDAGLETLLSQYTSPGVLAFSIAVGGARGRDRLQLFDKLTDRGLIPRTIVHRTAFVAADAMIGDGCQLLALSAVCSCSRLGRGVIVNTSASVDHDCIIDEGVHVGPGAHLAGEVKIGPRAFIGTGSVILPRVQIGHDAIVGAGAVVTHNVDAGATVVGNPAHVISARHPKPLAAGSARELS